MTKEDDDSTTAFPTSLYINEISPVKPSMQEMKIKIFITFQNQKVETQALIDCRVKGANYISRNFVNKMKIPLLSLKKKIPVLNVDGTENQDGTIHNYVDVRCSNRGERKRAVPLFSCDVSRPRNGYTGYPWLRQENPEIDWKKQTLNWRNEPHRIKMIEPREPFEDIKDDSLVILVITGKLADEGHCFAWQNESPLKVGKGGVSLA